jgi:hypothetical protein
MLYINVEILVGSSALCHSYINILVEQFGDPVI